MKYHSQHIRDTRCQFVFADVNLDCLAQVVFASFLHCITPAFCTSLGTSHHAQPTLKGWVELFSTSLRGGYLHRVLGKFFIPELYFLFSIYVVNCLLVSTRTSGSLFCMLCWGPV